MKSVKLLVLSVVMSLSGRAVLLAQTQPNLDNGFKPYGSYEGGEVDHINLQNGNLILHVPMPFSYPQRGGHLAPKNVLRATSKSWNVVTTINSVGTVLQYWHLGVGQEANIADLGSGVGFDHTMDLALHRLYEVESGPVSATIAGGYYLTTWDGPSINCIHLPTRPPMQPGRRFPMTPSTTAAITSICSAGTRTASPIR